MTHFASFGPALACLRLGWVLLGAALLLLPLGSRGQGRALVRGQVVSAAGPALELVTVTLHRAADSTVVKTEFSNAQGAFQLEASAGGSYRVSAAQVGFERYWSPAFELPAAGRVLPAIVLAVSATTALDEVAVTGRKPLFEHLDDRTVVNVADSPLSAGATTLGVLSRSPGVTLDATGNIALRGRQGLLVYLDGKRLPLTGSELADYLRAIPAEQLQSLELITNPPAQYDAQGGAGVIVIHLKKDQRLGTNGSLNASYGRGVYGKFTGGGSFNHRRKDLNFYGNYTYSDRNGFVRVRFDRQFRNLPTLPDYSSRLENEQLTHLRSHTAKLGLDLNLTPRTQLSVGTNALISQVTARTTNQTWLWDDAGQLTDRYASQVRQDLRRPTGAANLHLSHALADSAAAGTLSFDADYGRYNIRRVLDLNTTFQEPVAAPALLNGDQRSNLSIGAAKLDFSQPLPHRRRLDAGLKVTRIRSDNTVAFYNTVNGVRTYNSLISNSFQYDENVNAAYVSLRGKARETTLQAGLRAEQTNTRAAVTGDPAREQHYTQFFPTFSAQRSLNEQHGLAVTLARRIDRPNYAQLNPLRAYFDATSYSSGNPDLVAQTSYNLELTHTFRQKFSTALAYARTSLPIVKVVQPSPDGGRLVVNRSVNLRTQGFYTLTLTAPVELTKWWTLYANGLFYYNHFTGALAGTALDRGRLACNLTANNSLALPHGWSADLNALYESREVYGFEYVQSRGQVSAGMQKSLWDKRATLRFNVSDVFYTTPITSTATYDNFAETFYLRQDLRVATAAFTYRCGNGKLASAKKRATGAEEELRRASE